MDIELEEYLDSLKDKLMLVDKSGKYAKEIDHFISIICKNDENFVDYIRHIHESKRDSILFKNAASRHVGSLSKKIYSNYYKRIINTKSKLHKKVNEGYLNK